MEARRVQALKLAIDEPRRSKLGAARLTSADSASGFGGHAGGFTGGGSHGGGFGGGFGGSFGGGHGR